MKKNAYNLHPPSPLSHTYTHTAVDRSRSINNIILIRWPLVSLLQLRVTGLPDNRVRVVSIILYNIYASRRPLQTFVTVSNCELVRINYFNSLFPQTTDLLVRSPVQPADLSNAATTTPTTPIPDVQHTSPAASPLSERHINIPRRRSSNYIFLFLITIIRCTTCILQPRPQTTVVVTRRHHGTSAPPPHDAFDNNIVRSRLLDYIVNNSSA